MQQQHGLEFPHHDGRGVRCWFIFRLHIHHVRHDDIERSGGVARDGPRLADDIFLGQQLQEVVEAKSESHCISTTELGDLISNTDNAIITAAAKSAGTSFNEFAGKCLKQMLHAKKKRDVHNFQENVAYDPNRLEHILLESYEVPKSSPLTCSQLAHWSVSSEMFPAAHFCSSLIAKKRVE